MSAILQSGAAEFRQMLDDDLERIITIEQAAYNHPWTIGIFRDCMRVGYHCHVLVVDDDIQGYAVMSEAANEAHILNICINPEKQGCGYGRVMIEYLLDVARKLHVEMIFLEVRPSNTIARQLYESIGFCEIGQRKNYYPDTQGREDALILALTLVY